MPGYLLTPEALEDIEASGFTSHKTILKRQTLWGTPIHEACAKFTEFPQLGHTRNDLTERPVRFWRVRRNYFIVYNPASSPLKMLRVARDAAALLDDE